MKVRRTIELVQLRLWRGLAMGHFEGLQAL